MKKLFNGLETDYLDGFQYKFTNSWEDPSGTMTSDEMKLRIIPTSEGYFDALRNAYFYNYTDHLGNVRVSYSDRDGNNEVTGDIVVNNCYTTPDGQMCNNYIITGEAEGVTNYYPFGMMHTIEYNTFDNPYLYKYNGKELQETGMYDYGARFYMPDLGRWGVVDPLAETSRRFTPYHYGNNNPVRFTDPDGRQSWDNLNSYSQGSAVAGFMKRNGFGDENLPMFYSDEGGMMIANTALGNDGQGGGGSNAFEIGIFGAYAQAAFDLLKASMKDQLDLIFEDGMVRGEAVKGANLSEAAQMLLEAIKNPDIKVRLETVFGFRYYDANLETDVFALGDAFKGSFVYNGKVTATNMVSPKITEEFDKFLNSEKGVSFLHAALEAYIGALHFPGKDRNTAYDYSHAEAACIDPRYKDLPSNYIQGGSVQRNMQGRVTSETVFFRDINTNKIIIDFGTIKYNK